MNNLIFSNPAIGEIDMINDEYVRLVSLRGVSAEAQINTQAVTGKDGSTVNSATFPERQIIVEFRIRAGVDAEQAMHDLYRIFAAKSSGTMTFVGRLGSSLIDYVVQSIEIPPNQQQLNGVITLLCPNPYFRALEESKGIIAGSESLFKFKYHFPNTSFYISRRISSLFATVYNDGEADTGCVIVMKANAHLSNPALINVVTREEARIKIDMEAGDEIKIYTEKGEKKILYTHAGITTNIFNKMIYPFTFFQLAQGANTFKYEADEGAQSLDIDIEWASRFGAMYTNAPGAIEARMPYDEIEDAVRDIARIVRRGGIDDYD